MGRARTTEAPETGRDRVMKALADAGDAGCSKSELHRAAGINRGAFRKLIASLVSTGVVDVQHEYRELGGKTAVHRLPATASAIASSERSEPEETMP